MSPSNWAALIVSLIAIVTAFSGAVRWLVKHYLYELRPNGGASLKDSVSRLETKVETLNDLVMELIKR
jgi:hypothetical protein